MSKSKKKLAVEYISTEKLVPYANNARTHSDEQIRQIADSIGEFGFTNPVLIDEKNGVIAGHGRIMAAQLLKLDTIPTIKLSGLSDAQKKAYILADNQLALNACWDLDLLRSEFVDLQDMDFDTDLLGFSDEEMADIFPDEPKGLTDEDDVPETPEEPKTKLGDVYKLGRHRLLCGDSTKIEDVEKLMDGQKADMVFTSPPYNGNISFSTFSKNNMGKLYGEGYNDNLDKDEYINFCRSILTLCFSFTNGFILWNVNYNANSRSEYIEQVTPFLKDLIEQVCWEKSSIIPYYEGLNRKWEPIYIFKSGDCKNNFGHSGEVEGNLWKISNSGANHKDHRGCFPVELPEKGVLLGSVENNIILDPFGGSGSTMIACEKTNRNCYMMELDPKYCDVIVKRWEDYTGLKSELIS